MLRKSCCIAGLAVVSPRARLSDRSSSSKRALCLLPCGDDCRNERRRLLAAWFGGDAEGKPNVAIWGARLDNGRWTAPFELVREPDIATYNPVLFYSKDGTLWLYYKFGPHPDEWSAGRMFSRDDGKTWSQCRASSRGHLRPIKNKPLVLRDGAIVSGTSVESYKAWTAWVERSTDNAKTWTKHGPVDLPAACMLPFSRPLCRCPMAACGCSFAPPTTSGESPKPTPRMEGARGRP